MFTRENGIIKIIPMLLLHYRRMIALSCLFLEQTNDIQILNGYYIYVSI